MSPPDQASIFLCDVLMRCIIFTEVNNISIPFPVLPIVRCYLKVQHEPDWVVPAIVDNVRALLRRARPGVNAAELLKGLTVTVIGFGAIGEALTGALQRMEAIVRVVEKGNPQGELRKFTAQVKHQKRTGPLVRFASESDIIIGCTGEGPSVPRTVLDRLKDGAVLISTSSGNDEIDLGGLEAGSKEVKREPPQSQLEVMPIDDFTTYTLHNGRRIVVLYGGFPVNFWSRESMRSKHGDVILSLLFSAAAKIALGKVRRRGIIGGQTADQILKEEQARIALLYGAIYVADP